MAPTSQALLESLTHSPLLVGNLKDANCFDRTSLANIEDLPSLDLHINQKLGHLYEDVLAHALQHSPKLDLLGKNVQVFNENKITLGELDYILRERESEKVIHLELAIKFYLIKFVEGKPTYPGPDPRDNWINKLNRLEEHQLQFSKNPATQKMLNENYGVTELETQQLIYGKIFDHYLAEEKPNPPAINPACQRGTWKYLHEWTEQEKVTVIPKYLWPVENIVPLLESLTELDQESFKEEASQRCTMIWNQTAHTTEFIVPDTWG